MSEESIVGKRLPEWFVRSCNDCGDGYYVTRSIGKVATELDLICNKCKQAEREDNSMSELTSDLAATQEHLRLKELECEELAKDKKELVDMVRYLTICADDHPAKPATAAAHELLERLG